ncbi:taste receptor type 2 member 42-like [Arvicanthis niloticus]|uniref:taste receptor type 2 member 42-like n=1 Tax=Arvicanthis niloticus TaxID=61156 RepID=UPI001487404D|nr:taste receptor type 2 member 42-like [Arvicanthis niloticus]
MYMILVIAVCITGILGNVFIGLVNCSDWVKNQKITFINFILLCLAASRVSSVMVVFIDATILELAPHFYHSYTLAKCSDIFWVITDQLSTWLATCLSIFYLFKIAHFSHPLFLWLKWRLRGVLIVFLVFSLFLLIFYFLLVEILSIWGDIYVIPKSNLALFSDTSKTFGFQKIIVFDMMYLVPFLVSLASLLLLFFSLVKCSRNLVPTSTTSEDSRTKIHKKAMKMLVFFLVLFIIHIFCILVARWLSFLFPLNRSISFVFLTLNIFPLTHSCILILGNSKLRQRAMSVLQHLKRQLQELIIFLHRVSCLH